MGLASLTPLLLPAKNAALSISSPSLACSTFLALLAASDPYTQGAACGPSFHPSPQEDPGPDLRTPLAACPRG